MGGGCGLCIGCIMSLCVMCAGHVWDLCIGKWYVSRRVFCGVCVCVCMWEMQSEVSGVDVNCV